MVQHEAHLTDAEMAELSRLVLDDLKRCMVQRFGKTPGWTCDVLEAVAKAAIAFGVGVQHQHATFHLADKDAARLATFKLVMSMVGQALDIDFQGIVLEEFQDVDLGATVH